VACAERSGGSSAVDDDRPIAIPDELGRAAGDVDYGKIDRSIDVSGSKRFWRKHIDERDAAAPEPGDKLLAGDFGSVARLNRGAHQAIIARRMNCTAPDMNSRVRQVVGLAAICAVLLLATPVSAQYFGRNKVQYKKLDFQVLKTEYFDIYYYPSAREGIDIAARMAERWRARLGRILGHELSGRQPLVLYASHPDFEQTNTIQGELGEGTGGVTESLRRRIILPLGGPLADTDHVLGHEIVHAYQYDMTTNPNAPPGQNGASRLPLWFIEGMAEYLSIGPIDPNTAMWLRDVQRDRPQGDRRRRAWRRSERRSRNQPRRALDRVPVRTRSVFDRSIRR
jgi:hypothetical protein